MSKIPTVSEILAGMKNDSFVLNCAMNMGYVTGLPILQIKNEQLCLLVPFVRYKVTGEPDKTLVYPIRYTVTVSLPENKAVQFQELSFDERFLGVDFDKPVGFFRHDEIKHLNKQEYRSLRAELLGEYDKVIRLLLLNEDYDQASEDRMKKLLRLLTEPSLLPMYRMLDKDFYDKYFR